MRLFLLFLLNTAVVTAEFFCSGCITNEMCLKDIRSTLKAFKQKYDTAIWRIAQVMNVVGSIIEEEVENLNLEIMNSSESCRHHHRLNESNQYYLKKSSAQCVAKTCIEIDESFTDEIMNFPSNFTKSRFSKQKQFYCMYLVPTLNYYCQSKRYYLRNVMGCDYKNNFKLQFRQPWVNCIEKIENPNYKKLYQ